MIIVELCVKCLQPELREAGEPDDARTLKPVSIDGGQVVFRLCDSCRSETTVAELEALRGLALKSQRTYSVTIAVFQPGGEKMIATRSWPPAPAPASSPRRSKSRRPA